MYLRVNPERNQMYPIDHSIPVPPTVTLAGSVSLAFVSSMYSLSLIIKKVGNKMDKLLFDIDIMQYAYGNVRPASFRVEAQAGNNRFNKLDIRSHIHCALTGTITGEAQFGPISLPKRIPFEFYEIGFMTSDSGTSVSSPRKGVSYKLSFCLAPAS